MVRDSLVSVETAEWSARHSRLTACVEVDVVVLAKIRMAILARKWHLPQHGIVQAQDAVVSLEPPCRYQCAVLGWTLEAVQVRREDEVEGAHVRVA